MLILPHNVRIYIYHRTDKSITCLDITHKSKIYLDTVYILIIEIQNKILINRYIYVYVHMYTSLHINL